MTLDELTKAITEMTARDTWELLSDLGLLNLSFSPKVGLWHASCDGVMIYDGKLLYPMSTSATRPEDAVQAYWDALVTLPAGHKIVINSWRADKSIRAWNEVERRWDEKPFSS